MTSTRSLSTFDSVINEFRQDPFMVGFDNIFDRIINFQTQVSPTQKVGYPHYNVTKVDDDTFTIEVALAGFSEDDVVVTVKENILEVEGEISDKPNETVIHRGISARPFKRRWHLSDTIQVEGADFKNGLLVVYLRNVVPEEEKPRVIKVNADDRSLDNPEFLREQK